MERGVQWKGAGLALLLLVNSVLSSPLVKRDLSQLSQSAIAPQESSIQLDEGVFGGHQTEEESSGAREKRLLKLKALGIGAGLKAAGAGVKAVGLAAGKAVAKKAVHTAVKVGTTVAKAAITLGIAKVLLTLVFGKINQLIDFKTRLLGSKGGLLGSSNLSNLSGGSSGGLSGGSSGGGGGGGAGVEASADASFGLDSTTEAQLGYRR